MADNDRFDLDSFDFGDFDTSGAGLGARQPTATPDAASIVTSLKKRAMVVIFVVDISGSMRGARIGAVNDAIRNVLDELKKRERTNTSAEIRIAILEFSTRANWRTLSPIPVSEYQYTDIVNVYGGTNYGSAFAALNEKLSTSQFLHATAGAYTPLIIFMTDGKPSDMGLYPEELSELRRNKWFRYATRAGIAIEEGAMSPECKKVLTEFTENEQNVYEAKNTVILAKQIQLVTLTGVNLVTQQGSIQTGGAPVSFPANPAAAAPANPTAAQGEILSPPSAKPMNPVSPPPSQTASPTLPIGEINWDSDFDF